MDWFSASQAVLSIATLVKIAVALLRMAMDPPRWGPPVVGAVAGVVFGLLFMIANGTLFSLQSVTQAILQGLLGVGVALGIVEQIETRGRMAILNRAFKQRQRGG